MEMEYVSMEVVSALTCTMEQRVHLLDLDAQKRTVYMDFVQLHRRVNVTVGIQEQHVVSMEQRRQVVAQ